MAVGLADGRRIGACDLDLNHRPADPGVGHVVERGRG
jgi:hypothetical protein